MSSNFENGYNWADDMQPQNLSRYQSGPVTHEEMEVVPQYYANLFPPLQSSVDDVLLKRNNLNPVHCQQRPINSGIIGDHKSNDMLYPELTAIDTLHHSSSNGYGNYNILTHSLPHNPPDPYLEDRFLGLGGGDLESNEHPGNFINSFDSQFYPSHINSLVYSSGLQPIDHEDNVYGIVPSDEIRPSAVLDLSPTVSSSMRDPPEHGEALAYSLAGGAEKEEEANHQQAKLNSTSSYSSSQSNNECGALFKNNYVNSVSISSDVKHESANHIAVDIPILSYEPVLSNSSSLLNTELDQNNLAFFQPIKKIISKPFKESFTPNTMYSESVMEERFKGGKTYSENLAIDERFREFKAYNESPSLTESAQYFDCGLPTVCTSSKPMKQMQSPMDIFPERYSATEILHQKYPSSLTSRFSNPETDLFIDVNENPKFLMDLTRKREESVLEPSLASEAKEEERREEKKGVKKSERLMRAKVCIEKKNKEKKEEEEREAATAKPAQKVSKPKKRPVSCNQCSAQFSEWNSLKTHLYLHTGERPFACSACNEQFTKSSALSVHELKHTGEKPHKCHVCDKSFRLFSTLKSHRLTHTGEKPFQCEVCHATFTQRSALTRHGNIHIDLKPFTCDVCGNSYRDRFYYNKHKASHELKAKHTCLECGEGFYSNKKLQIHSIKHNEGPFPYKCNKCPAEFVNQKAWKQHKRRNHERNEELTCEDCNATFKRKESFKAHKKVHTGDYLIKCNICEANFNNVGTLKKHMKRHDSNNSTSKKTSELKPSPSLVPCYKCKRTFSTTRQMRTHRCYDKLDDDSGSRSSSSTSNDWPDDKNNSPDPNTEDRKDETPFLSSSRPFDTSRTERTKSAFDFDVHLNRNDLVCDLPPSHDVRSKSVRDSSSVFDKKFDSRFGLHPRESNAVNLLSAALEV